MNPKFRAWHPKEKQMYEVAAISLLQPGTHELSAYNEPFCWVYKKGSPNCQSKYCSKDLILMQWTGLQDRNGKNIYADDILEYNGEKYIVPHPVPVSRWNEAENINDKGQDNDDWNSWPETYHVIGNIYQNPELLNVNT